jgi:hypothetical protein
MSCVVVVKPTHMAIYCSTTDTKFYHYLQMKILLFIGIFPNNPQSDIVAYPGFFWGGRGDVQQIQLRIEGRENGDLQCVCLRVKISPMC